MIDEIKSGKGEMKRAILDFGVVRENQDLTLIAAEYTSLNKYGSGPCPMCGGEDRFYIKRGDQYWACRKCGKHGDVIDLVALCEGISKTEAAKLLLGIGTRRSRTASPESERSWLGTSSTGQAKPRPALSTEISTIVQRACDHLVRSQKAVDYLNCRGISRAAATSYLVGFDPARFDPRTQERRSAITFPITNESKRIVGLKYRFFDALALENKSNRFSQEKGSTPGLFGAHLLPDCGHDRILLAVEGEFNALSLAQSLTGLNIDVVSIGSDSGGQAVKMLHNVIAGREHSQVILWMDEGERAITIGRDLGTPILIRSPEGMDANDLLLKIGSAGLRQLVETRLRELAPRSTGNSAQEAPKESIRQNRLPNDLANEKLVVWDKRIAEVHAWALWVKKYARAAGAPELRTTGECVQYVLEIWRAEGATIPDE